MSRDGRRARRRHAADRNQQPAVRPFPDRQRLHRGRRSAGRECRRAWPLCWTKRADLGRARKVAYIELRDCAAAGPGWQSRGDLYAGFEGPIARDEADNLKQIPRKQRAVVRKALEQGFTISIERSIQPFFDLYARTLRDHGTPILPRRFYENLLTVFGEACEILTVSKDGVPTSSVMSFFYRDKVLPYYTGSLVEARRSGANDMMYWALMRRAVERGATVFDFGRSKVGTGPYSFKSNWGFTPRPITPPISAAGPRQLAQSQSHQSALCQDDRGLAAFAGTGRQCDFALHQPQPGVSAMADLLFLTQRIPYPPIKGEKIRPLQILQHLRKIL